jgi:hypothetical protein
MLSADMTDEIDRLLQLGELSQRQIAIRLHVSRGTVNAIATGRRVLRGNGPLPVRRLSSSRSARCPACGYRVYAPCLICSVRLHKNRELLIRRVHMESLANARDFLPQPR